MSEPILTEAKERWQECADAASEQRLRMLEELQFSNPADPQQWDPAARRAREQAEGGARPCLTVDVTNQFIHQVVNDARQNRPGINVLPVNSSANVKTANYLEGLVRQIEYSSNADVAYDTSIDHAARCGVGWIRVLTKVTNAKLNEQEIEIASVEDPMSAMISPESTKPDGSDAYDGFVDTTLTKRQFERKYGTDKHSSWQNDSGDAWSTAETIRVSEYYKLVTTPTKCLDITMPDGTVATLDEEEYRDLCARIGQQVPILHEYQEEERSFKWYLLTGDDIIDETEVPSEWVPIIPVYGNVLWIQGKRYVSGLTRQLMDGQRFRNLERSAWLELMQMQPKSPFLVPFESIGEFRPQWENANRSNASYLPYYARDDQGQPLPPPSRLAPPMSSPAILQAGQAAVDDMSQSVGMYKSNFGAPSNAVSGRAKMQDQREGDTATFHYVDNQRRSISHVGRIVLGMAPKIYNTEREIRTLNLDGSSNMVRLTQNGPAHADNGRTPAINLAAGKYDVRVKAGPSYSTARQEANDALTQILSQNGSLMPILGPTWARLQDFPDSDKVARLLLSVAPAPVQAIENEDARLDPQAQQQVAALQSQIQQLQQQLQAASAAANQNLTDAHVKMDELEVQRYQAVTQRISSLLDAGKNPQLSPAAADFIAQQLLSTMAQTQLVDSGPGAMPPPGMAGPPGAIPPAAAGPMPQGLPPQAPPAGMQPQ